MFCRSEGRMSREHVFAHWLTTLGLAVDEVEHWGGPLNRMPESKGRFVPFTITVHAVCEPCNTGWMSSLVGDIVPTLRPILLGQGGTIHPTAAGRPTKWTAYLICTKVDSAHVEVPGNPEAVMKEYDEEPGVEIVVVDEYGSFFCKKSPRA